MTSNSRIAVPKDVFRTLRGTTPRERFLHRLHSVVLVLDGQSASEVARLYGDSPRAVAYWVSRFHNEGLSGLEDEQRPGRPGKLSPTQMRGLQTFLNQERRRSKSITAETLASFILTEFGISITDRQCWRILKKLGS